MIVFLTGATGFIGGATVRALVERGHTVRALVRRPERATDLRDLGVTLVAGGLDDRTAVRAGVEGADAVVHGAGVYRVGIRLADRDRMRSANVDGTARVLGAALEAGTPRTVYVSTTAIFGDTRGRVVEEGYRRPVDLPYVSYYEQTQVEAHALACEVATAGLPLVTLLPGVVYGPGDHSEIGEALQRFLAGRLPGLPFADMGLSVLYVGDAADGIVAALDRGRPGEDYVLTAQVVRLHELLDRLAALAGRRPPRLRVPSTLLKALNPVGRFVGPPLGLPPNLDETVRASAGVTYWAHAGKARRELGWRPRSLDDGLSLLLAAFRAEHPS